MADSEFSSQVSDLLDCAAFAFGIDVTYMPVKGGSHAIKAIFDNQWEQVDPDTETVIASNLPRINVKLQDLKKLGIVPCKKDRVDIKGVLYQVIDSQEDGQGASELILHKVC